MYFAMSASMAMSVACSTGRPMSKTSCSSAHACPDTGKIIMPGPGWTLPLTQEPPALELWSQLERQFDAGSIPAASRLLHSSEKAQNPGERFAGRTDV